MKIFLQTIAIIFTAIFLVNLTFPKQTYAYLDPGANSYLFQIAIASLLGAILTVKLFFRKIVNFLRNLLTRREALSTKDANKKNSPK